MQDRQNWEAPLWTNVKGPKSPQSKSLREALWVCYSFIPRSYQPCVTTGRWGYSQSRLRYTMSVKHRGHFKDLTWKKKMENSPSLIF